MKVRNERGLWNKVKDERSDARGGETDVMWLKGTRENGCDVSPLPSERSRI